MRGGPQLLRIGEPLPPANRADAEGLVAIGGALGIARVMAAYRRGIFPWPLLGSGGQVLWFSPDPRFVVAPGDTRVSRSLRKLIDRGRFHVTCDQSFGDVVACCARVQRSGQVGTWITPELESAFFHLHQLGYAHSVEVWDRTDGVSAGEQRLVGGLYGLSLGRVFFGESMFSLCSNASKVAFARLAQRLAAAQFALIDCQQETEHLARFGARSVPRETFLETVSQCADLAPVSNPWEHTEWN